MLLYADTHTCGNMVFQNILQTADTRCVKGRISCEIKMAPLNAASFFLLLQLYFILPAFMAHCDIAVIPTEKDLTSFSYDVSLLVYSGVDCSLATAGTYGFYFSQ